MKSMKRIARESGLLYLLLGITGMIGLLYVPGQIFVAGDIQATAKNLQNSETLLRIGLLCNIVCQITFVFLVLSLRRLFFEVNPLHTRVMVTLVVVAIPVAFFNCINLLAVLLVSGSEYMSAFSPEQKESLMQFFWDLHNGGITLVSIFWGLWLIPFGYLVIRSGFIQKLFGILLIIGGFGYIFDSLTGILFPEYRDSLSMIFTTPSGIAELAMIAWLLIKGVKGKPSGD